jgi:DNA-directed RNA polymerase I and III subunit RPAC2
MEEPEQTLKISGEPTSTTFTFVGEGHTLGNALRYALLFSPDTSFCGYSVPHPSEVSMNLRLQTASRPATEVLDEGLTKVSQVCDRLLELLPS